MVKSYLLTSASFYYICLLLFIYVVTRIVKRREFEELREAKKMNDIERFRSTLYNILKFDSLLLFTLSEPYMYIIDTYVLGVKYPAFIDMRMGVYLITLTYLIALKTGKMKFLWWGKRKVKYI